MIKRLSYMLLLAAFTLAVAVSFSDATAIDKAPVKSELVVQMDLDCVVPSSVSLDAEVMEYYLAVPEPQFSEHPYTFAQYNVLRGFRQQLRGPPEFRS